MRREKYGETIVASAAKTATANTSTSPIDVSNYKEANFFLDVTVVSGTNPTLDVLIKTKDPVSGKWFTIATFTQATAATTEMKSVAANLGTQIATYYTIGGTDTPTFTFSLSMLAKT